MQRGNIKKEGIKGQLDQCPAGEAGRQCYHRRYAVAFLIYLDPEISMRLANLEYEVRELNQHLLNLIEGEAELEAYETMMSDAA
jgi:hypothetical protein